MYTHVFKNIFLKTKNKKLILCYSFYINFSENILQVRNEFSPPPNLSILKQGGALILYRALRGWGTGGFFEKSSAPYRMSLISAGSISLTSTFKKM